LLILRYSHFLLVRKKYFTGLFDNRSQKLGLKYELEKYENEGLREDYKNT
jgi:hypothetical protein